MTCSNVFNVSPSPKDKTQGPTQCSQDLPFPAPSFLSLPYSLVSPSPTPIPLPSLRLTLHCSNTKHSHSRSYATLLWLHTFISFPLAFSWCLPNELFLKFLLMNHQFNEALPWTSLSMTSFLLPTLPLSLLHSISMSRFPQGLQKSEGWGPWHFLGAIPWPGI